jgi:alpha-1,2-mannosyltransferase
MFTSHRYYRTFMFFYAFSLRKASFLVVNSSWTKAHIDSILYHDNGLLDILSYLPPLVFLRPSLATLKPVEIVYPPCDTRELAELPLEGRGRTIVSLAQFRPEKDHRTQLLALSSLLEFHPEYRNPPVKMVLMGGSRNAEDAERVKQLRSFAKDLRVEVRRMNGLLWLAGSSNPF